MPFSSGKGECIQAVISTQSMIFPELLKKTPYQITGVDNALCCAAPLRSDKYSQYILNLSNPNTVTIIDESIVEDFDYVVYLTSDETFEEMATKDFIKLCDDSTQIHIADIARITDQPIEPELVLNHQKTDCAITDFDKHFQMECLRDEYDGMKEVLDSLSNEEKTRELYVDWLNYVSSKSCMMQLSVLKYGHKNNLFSGAQVSIEELKVEAMLTDYSDYDIKSLVEELFTKTKFIADKECRAHTIDCLLRGSDIRVAITEIAKATLHSEADIERLYACTKMEQLKSIMIFSAVKETAGIEFVNCTSLNMHLTDSEIMRCRFGFDINEAITKIVEVYNFDEELSELLTAFYSTHLLTHQTKRYEEVIDDTKIAKAGHSTVIRAIAKLMVDGGVISDRSYKSLNRQQAETILSKLCLIEPVENAIKKLKMNPDRHSNQLLHAKVESPINQKIIKESERYVANI